MKIFRMIREAIDPPPMEETLHGKMRAVMADLEAELRSEGEFVLASLPSSDREREAPNLDIARTRAIWDALDCLAAHGEPEFAMETGRAAFAPWLAMARGGK